jgi:hypothetical protein
VHGESPKLQQNPEQETLGLTANIELCCNSSTRLLGQEKYDLQTLSERDPLNKTRSGSIREKPFQINAIYTRRFLGARHPLCGIGV